MHAKRLAEHDEASRADMIEGRREEGSEITVA
jgi:hypothetical protein